MKRIDMIGKPCPMPVVEARKALMAPGCDGVVVLVDNTVATGNLERLAGSLECRYACVQQGERRYAVTITTGEEAPFEGAPRLSPSSHREDGPTVLITSDAMGQGSDELGRILMKGFVFSLSQLPVLPKAVYFLNGGVRLTVEGSNALEDLRTLEKQGVALRSCGTCLNYYQLTDQLQVGEITDMYGISSALAEAAHLISI